MKSIGGILGGQEKAKWGNLWDWIKRRYGKIHICFALVGTGELTIHMYSTWRWCKGNKITMNEGFQGLEFPSAQVVP